MHLVTFKEPVVLSLKKSAGQITQTYEAGRPYLFSSVQIDRLIRTTNVMQKIYKLSRAETRIPNAHVAAFKPGESVLLYNGSGGYGDQILTWPIAKYLSDMGMKVHVLADPGNNVCWWGFDFVRAIQTIPILWDVVCLYNHICIWEAVVNADEHQDQEHPVDMMFRKIGIDPKTVPDTAKVVRPQFTVLETLPLEELVKKHQKIGMYQLASTNPVRALPPKDSAFMISKIAAEFKDIHWLCLYDIFVPEKYMEEVREETKKNGLDNVELYTAQNLRELWALTERASVVVAPDSMMVHVAGMLGIPCVGLWGITDPKNRVGYYKNHYAVWPKHYCRHAPCYHYNNDFPPYCPPRPMPRTVCDVLAGIKPQDVIEKIHEALAH